MTLLGRLTTIPLKPVRTPMANHDVLEEPCPEMVNLSTDEPADTAAVAALRALRVPLIAVVAGLPSILLWSDLKAGNPTCQCA